MVTLVVPIYNMERYFPRCMNSLLNQTSWDYEILLIDDGSTDASSSLCDHYAAAHPGLVRVIHKENGGLSSARNAGIDHARGEFIVFPDPDDWAEPDYVESFMEFQRQYQADMVCLGYCVDTDTISHPGYPGGEPVVMNGYEAQRGLLLPPRMQGFSWNKLYRLDIIRTHGLHFFDGMGTTEDLFFAYQYLAHAKSVCHAPGTSVYHYCQRNDSSTHSSFSSDKMGTIRTYEHIIEDCSAQDPELAHCVACEICTAAVNLIWLYECSGVRDEAARQYLLGHIRRLLPRYMGASCYGAGRKLQAVLAAISPKIYKHLKNAVQRR